MLTEVKKKFCKIYVVTIYVYTSIVMRLKVFLYVNVVAEVLKYFIFST